MSESLVNLNYAIFLLIGKSVVLHFDFLEFNGKAISLFFDLHQIPCQSLHFLIVQTILLVHKLPQFNDFLLHTVDFEHGDLKYFAEFVENVNKLNDQLCRPMLVKIVGK